ncbi:MAG: mycothiol transferase [Jatrophihabitans sp.]
MSVADLLSDAFGRVAELVSSAIAGLSTQQLAVRPAGQANSIGWLIWHLTRIQDDHVADAAGGEQVWTGAGWYDRFGLPFDPAATGYGQRAADVAAVQVSAELLAGYHEAVHRRTADYLAGLSAADLGRVVDENWDPPVTLGVRLVSVLSDDLQHVGQAAYARGLLDTA